MMAISLAIVWLVIVFFGLVVFALLERRSRLLGLPRNSGLEPPRANWGFDSQPPPVHYLLLRALAGGARLVRSRTTVLDHSATLRSVSRFTSWFALASAFSLIPFAGTWGGGSLDRPLIGVDLQHGLPAIVLFVFLMGFAQVGLGLADRSPWSRLGSVGIASQMLGGLGLLVLVLAPLALEAGSLRLHDIVSDQQQPFYPFSKLPASLSGGSIEFLGALRWPSWNVFVQPLTALLFLACFAVLTRRPWVWAHESFAGSASAAGFGFDGDPIDLYWGRLEARLAKVFAASLFVALFLGAGAIPFLPASAIVAFFEPFVGFAFPAFIVVAIGIGVFIGKLVLVLLLGARIGRICAALHVEQWTEIVALRLVPLAWANLLLMSALTLLSEPLSSAFQGGS